MISNSIIKTHQFWVYIVNNGSFGFNVEKQSSAAKERFDISSCKSRHLQKYVRNLLCLSPSVFNQWFHIVLFLDKGSVIFKQTKKDNSNILVTKPFRTFYSSFFFFCYYIFTIIPYIWNVKNLFTSITNFITYYGFIKRKNRICARRCCRRWCIVENKNSCRNVYCGVPAFSFNIHIKPILPKFGIFRNFAVFIIVTQIKFYLYIER